MNKAARLGMTVGDVCETLNAMAPPRLAQDWDNVGLLAGNRASLCRRVLLCIDLAPAVLEEALSGKADLIVAYHPPLFRPISRLLADSGEMDAVIYKAIAGEIAIYSPHTALDAAVGGTNDMLADLCGLTEIEPFEYVTTGSARGKVVTFVPSDRVEAVASAMADAGAGRIGHYEQCSYRLEGTGTFFGTEGTKPAIGRPKHLEHVTETRIEMVSPERLLPDVIAALKQTHPYEEPAFDIYPLQGEPEMGIGRVGSLPGKMTLGRLARSLQQATGSRVLTMVGAAGTRLERAAVCAGAAGRLPLEKQNAAHCDVIVTGEIRHHDALTILRRGKTAVAIGHWESERPMLPILRTRLTTAHKGLKISISRSDRAPFARINRP